jgi:hypothetical protein
MTGLLELQSSKTLLATVTVSILKQDNLFVAEAKGAKL